MSERHNTNKDIDYTRLFREHYRAAAEPLTDWRRVAYGEVKNFLDHCKSLRGISVQLHPFKGVDNDRVHLDVAVDGVYGQPIPVVLFLHSVDAYCEKHNIISTKVGLTEGESKSIRLLDHSFNYENLLDAIIRQAAIHKSRLDMQASAGMKVT
tara:strand:- start:61081 stop:61539 length:459 start_codon:yes stop_codon:yes gene_type:complete